MAGKEMTAPWTPRERALRAALELYRQHDEISNDWIAWVGPQAEETRLKAKELWFAFRREAFSALADDPPPDQRDEALRLAITALETASGAFNAYTVHHAAKRDEVKQAKNQCLRDQMDAAITAIRAAKGGE